MKLDLNVPVLDLAGEVIKEGNKSEALMCGRMLSNYLVAGSKGDAIKFFDWAQALYKGMSIDVDNSDFKKLRDFVNDNENISLLVKAQILKTMDECEKRSTKTE